MIVIIREFRLETVTFVLTVNPKTSFVAFSKLYSHLIKRGFLGVKVACFLLIFINIFNIIFGFLINN